MILHLVISLVVVGAVVEARPQSSAHVKFSSPLQTYSHGVELPGASAHLKISPPLQTYSHVVDLPVSGRQGGGSVVATRPRPRDYLRARGGTVQTHLRPRDYLTPGGGAVETHPREYLLERRSRFIQPNSLYYTSQSLESSSQTSPEGMYPTGVFLPPDHDELQYLDAATSDDDPLLITGEEAKIAVANLFSRGSLYYDQIPHVRALRRHEEERRRNGLSIHLLSSNRPESPFYRGGAASDGRRASFLSY